MRAIPAPLRRVLLSLCLLGGVVLLAAMRSDSTMELGSAQLWLALAAVGGAVVLWKGRRGGRPDDWVEPALEVRARTGLTSRCGLALIEADGQSFLVVHGEGFATVHGMSSRRVPVAAPAGRELMQ